MVARDTPTGQPSTPGHKQDHSWALVMVGLPPHVRIDRVAIGSRDVVVSPAFWIWEWACALRKGLGGGVQGAGLAGIEVKTRASGLELTTPVQGLNGKVWHKYLKVPM